MRILVTGATGYVGSRLVSALLDAGHDVIAAARNPDRLADFGWHDQVTEVALDAHDEASAKKAFADTGPIDVVSGPRMSYAPAGTRSPSAAATR